jgi:hypothetical protein
MSRALIAIGINRYDHLPNLRGAEVDAQRIRDQLVGSAPYQYRSELSTVLLSPTTSQLREAILAVSETRPAAITLYFAGHAESREGRLYLKFKDTRDDLLAITGITFSTILDLLTLSPGIEQVNIVLDACNAGGMLGDLAKLLGEQAQHSRGGASVSILAGSSANDSARENAAGGYLTNAVCDVLSGKVVVQRWSRFLDLSQISESVQREPAVSRQNPSFWAVNLRGPNHFSQNPAFDPSVGATAVPDTFFRGGVPLDGDQLRAIRTFLHSVATDGYDHDILRPVQTAISSLTSQQQVNIYLGLAETVQFHDDSTVLAPQRELMLIQALLPLCEDTNSRSVLSIYTRNLARNVTERLMKLKARLDVEPNSLIDTQGGFSDLYFLPLTITDVLGWIGFSLVHDKHEAQSIASLRSLLNTVLSSYGNALRCVEDSQAPSIATFFAGTAKCGWTDECEEVLCRLYIDTVATGGRIAKANLDGRQKLAFLSSRYDILDEIPQLTKKPNELAGVLLLAGAIMGLDDVWDEQLIKLDHLTVNFFVPATTVGYANERIPDGDNVTLRVGDEFHTLADLRRVLHLPHLSTLNPLASELAMQLDAISISFTDRFHWPLFIKLVAQGDIRIRRPHVTLSAEDVETHTLTPIYDSEK